MLKVKVDVVKSLAKKYPVRVSNRIPLAMAKILTGIDRQCKEDINAHMSAGITYKNPGSTTMHTASKPNFPPNTNTGTLVKSIRWFVDKAKLTGGVGTDLKYGKHLEFGTMNMAPRPWLRPVVREWKQKIEGFMLKVLRERS